MKSSPMRRTPMKPRQTPLRARSAKRAAYLAGEAHQAAYEALEAFCVGHALGAPGRCLGPLTPHHTAPRGTSGGLEAAERTAPVVALCAGLNDAIQSDPAVRAWATSHTFTRGGVAYPFLITRHREEA